MYPSGKNNPLDPEPIAVEELKTGMVVYNPVTGKAQAVSIAMLEQVPGWVEKGAQIMVSHWATCSKRAQVREETDAGETRECPVPGCTTMHARSLLMCRSHWSKVPKALQTKLYAAYDHGKGIATEEYDVARTLCIEAALFHGDDNRET
jgi:hypothetical protein